MGITRKVVSWLPYVGGFLTMVAAFDWVDYHTKGSTPLWGINPRCIDSSLGYCWKLDPNNMPWGATLATWLGQGVWYVASSLVVAGAAAAVAGAMSGLLLLTRVAASSRQERLSRLADSPRLGLETWGLAWLLVCGIASALFWADMQITALALFVLGSILTIFASVWVMDWGSRCRHERFLRAEAHKTAEIEEALMNRVPASLRRFGVVYRFGYVGGIRHSAGKRRHIGVTQQ
jgi:hypothetical protein